MKKEIHHFHLGKTTITVLMAVAFLSFILVLSYLFFTGAMK